MPNPNFNGAVTATVYYGTLFDSINVPYRTEQIINTATKTKVVETVAVWQNSWLSTLRINVNGSDDIMGAQYVSLRSVNGTDNTLYWYDIVGYNNISANCVELTIAYDPVLTIGINNMTAVYGKMRRWTVMRDTPWRFTRTSEPIDQGEPLSYEYARFSVGGRVTSTPSLKKIVGFNVDVSTDPEIAQYTNIGSGLEGTYTYTKTANPAYTTFTNISGEGRATFSDGLQYHDNFGEIQDNYSKFIGLGFDLVTQSYLLPNSELITASYTPRGSISELKGTEQNFAPFPELPLKYTGSNNSKTDEIGVFFTLYNEVSGDAVTVANYDLNNNTVDIGADPYINGCFYARFNGYLDDNNGMSGIVKAPTWSPVSVSSRYGSGQIKDAVTLDINNQMLTNQQNYTLNSERLSAISGISNALNNVIGSGMNTAKNVVGGGMMYGVPGAVSGVLMSAPNIANSTLQYDITRQQQEMRYNYLSRDAQLQYTMLDYRGNINAMQPPAMKYAQTTAISPTSYDFVIMRSQPGNGDLARIDNFFTAYGYNVDGLALNSHNQLIARERFTFIQVDDFRITSITGKSNTKFMDEMTTDYIKDRFSAGLRIWRTTPDYDFSRANAPVDTSGDATDDNPSSGGDDPVPVEPVTPPVGDTDADKIIDLAILQLGTAENPDGSNKIKYNTDYYNRVVSGDAYPWCAVFVWWVFRNANLSQLYYGGSKTASCSTLRRYYERNNQTISIDNVQPGDLIFFNWDADPTASISNHMGIFIKWIDNTHIQTIEGNSNNRVEYRTRSISLINGVANPYT